MNSCTALQIALESGSLEIPRILLENGAKLPSQDPSESWDPLVSALYGREQQVIELVLARMGSAPNTQEYIQACIKLGRCAPIKKLIEEGHIRMGGDASRPEVICTAIFENDTDFARSLLSGTIESFGCMPIAYGAAALVAAVFMKNISLIHMLLEAGARPCVSYEAQSSSNAPHHTLLEERIKAAGLRWPQSSPGYARVSGKNAFDAISGRSDLATLLFGACNDSRHESPGQHSCRHAMENAFMNSIEVEADAFSLTHSFIAAGVDVNCRPLNHGCSALQKAMELYASEKKHGDILERLLVAGADVDCAAVEFEDISDHYDYHTPLQYAAKINDVYLVDRFIQQGANVNASPVRSQGATALQFAAMEGNFDILNILLEAGAEINAPPSSFDGRTAIEGAAEWGRLDIVRYLLEAGADVKGKGNRQYRRSIWRAWTEGHQVLANMIQNYKISTYGCEDISSIEDIVSSMSEIELERGKEGEENGNDDVVRGTCTGRTSVE
jgi:ankyrin repeat protein